MAFPPLAGKLKRDLIYDVAPHQDRNGVERSHFNAIVPKRRAATRLQICTAMIRNVLHSDMRRNLLDHKTNNNANYYSWKKYFPPGRSYFLGAFSGRQNSFLLLLSQKQSARGDNNEKSKYAISPYCRCCDKRCFTDTHGPHGWGRRSSSTAVRILRVVCSDRTVATVLVHDTPPAHAGRS
jgi:hypothetical protein